MAYCQGTPLRSEIELRDPLLLGDATVAASNALAQRFGPRHYRKNAGARVRGQEMTRPASVQEFALPLSRAGMTI